MLSIFVIAAKKAFSGEDDIKTPFVIINCGLPTTTNISKGGIKIGILYIVWQKFIMFTLSIKDDICKIRDL